MIRNELNSQLRSLISLNARNNHLQRDWRARIYAAVHSVSDKRPLTTKCTDRVYIRIRSGGENTFSADLLGHLSRLCKPTNVYRPVTWRLPCLEHTVSGRSGWAHWEEGPIPKVVFIVYQIKNLLCWTPRKHAAYFFHCVDCWFSFHFCGLFFETNLKNAV